jgi:hypothetical protein
MAVSAMALFLIGDVVHNYGCKGHGRCRVAAVQDFGDGSGSAHCRFHHKAPVIVVSAGQGPQKPLLFSLHFPSSRILRFKISVRN